MMSQNKLFVSAFLTMFQAACVGSADSGTPDDPGTTSAGGASAGTTASTAGKGGTTAGAAGKGGAAGAASKAGAAGSGVAGAAGTGTAGAGAAGKAGAAGAAGGSTGGKAGSGVGSSGGAGVGSSGGSAGTGTAGSGAGSTGGTGSAGSTGSTGGSGSTGGAGSAGGTSSAGAGSGSTGGSSGSGDNGGSSGVGTGGSAGSAAGAGGSGVAGSGTAGSGGSGTGSAGLTVKGNTLYRNGKPFQAHGANHSGTEYACAQGWGFFDGPSDDSLFAMMPSWNINVVRLPMNEDCWLNINGVVPAYGGDNYRKAIQGLVDKAHAHGLAVILDLHWNGAGSELALGQQKMADRDHAPAFWKAVATWFANDPDVMFDLYNEPHDISWPCWQNGCTDPGFQTAGMQELVDAVRSTGATQPLLIGGVGWAGDPSQWEQHAPVDPLSSLVVSVHNYNFGGCKDAACWDATIGPVAATRPVITGELGEDDCGGSYVSSYMAWADKKNIGYLGWTWNTWSCGGGPSLISAYDGSPTPLGTTMRAHYLTLPLALS